MKFARRHFFAAMAGLYSLLFGKGRQATAQDIGDPHQVVDDQYGLTRIHVAARTGDTTLLEALLSNGGDPNVEDASGVVSNGKTPLYWALNAECVDILLSHGAEIEYRGGYSGQPPISYLAVRNRYESVARLIEKGARVNDVDNMGMTPLIWCLAGLSMMEPDDPFQDDKDLRLKTALLLINNGADINHSQSGSTALGCAIKYAPEYIPTFLKLGADPTIPDNGRSLLDWATEWDNPATIKLIEDALRQKGVS